MKRISMIILACLLILSASTAFGQTRRRTTSRKGRSAATSPRNQNAPAAAQAIASAAGRVAEQIKSLGRFLYLYGPISRELASGETGARNNQSASAAEAVERNRAKLREVFRSYSAQMDELETTFSSTQELRLYYSKLLGVAASATQAEEAVAAGRYNAAGNSLLDVMSRLTDVLVEMRSR